MPRSPSDSVRLNEIGQKKAWALDSISVEGVSKTSCLLRFPFLQHNNWSNTGPKGIAQPDGTLKANGWGNEACMALLDNKFGDGLKWHDEPCNTRRFGEQ